MLFRRVRDDEMVVQNTGFDPPRVSSDVEYVFAHVETLIREMFGYPTRLFEDVRPRRDYEACVRRLSDSIHQSGEIGVLVS